MLASRCLFTILAAALALGAEVQVSLAVPPAPAPAARPAADPLANLDDDPSLRRSAEIWLSEHQAAGSDERVDIASVRRFTEAPGAAVILLTRALKAEPEAAVRSFGLISTRPDGAQTLTMPSEPCGELQDSLMDLHGDGARFAVFTEVGGGYHCHLTGTTVAYELVGERWVSAVAPEDGSGSSFINADTVPDFATPLVSFNLGECNYAACGDYFFRVDIMGYQSWDGAKFSSEKRYRAFYRAQYRELAELAKTIEPPQECALDQLENGVRAFGYAILSGRSRAQALALARSFFRGIQPERCTENGALIGLPQLEKQLLQMQAKLEALR